MCCRLSTGRYLVGYWMRATGHGQPIIASTQRSLERLLLSETCLIVSFRTSATTLATLAGQALACIEDPVVIDKILTHLDEKAALAEPLVLPQSRAPPSAGLFD